MITTVDDETALEEVLGFLDHPPQAGSADDSRFGERMRQVIAASIPSDDDDLDDSGPRLHLSDDIRRRLDAVARRRNAAHPFGDHPDGIGPTLGMDLGTH